jgi:uncharacterized protein
MFLQNENIKINQRDKLGKTALIEASSKGKKDIVQTLLQHKNIEINQHDKDGSTALIEASSGGHTDIVQMLYRISV